MFDFIISNDMTDAKAFKWFINNHGPLDSTNLLTIDMLWDFFYGKGQNGLNDDVRVILDSYSLLKADKITPDEQRVLKTVLLLQAISLRVSDAPLLKTCDIVDLPGFGTETESDDNITFAAAQKADVVIYLSQANGFMRIEDITYLKRNISGLPCWEKRGENSLNPLSNLFIVASQAHTVSNGNRAQLKR